MNINSPNQILVQKIKSFELSKQDTISDVKYQDITYHMDNRDKTVYGKEHAQIDFLNAMNELENLDWNYENNYITFVNNKTEECVQFLRKSKNNWYAEVPINDGPNWDGYTWSCDIESKPIMDMLRLYFEEVPWFGMLSWKMRRFKH